MSIRTSLNTLRPTPPEFLEPYLHRITADVNIITLAYHPGGFIFDETWANMVKDDGRPVVVMDFREYGWENSWNHSDLPTFWCSDLSYYMEMYGCLLERVKLLNFINNLPVSIVYKRELSKRCWDIAEFELKSELRINNARLLPIELLSPNLPQSPEPDKDEYMAREPGAFSLCGMSHPDRRVMHEVLSFANNGSGRHHVEEVDHTQRRHLMDVMALQGHYMASLNLGGAGEKCFRGAEACWNSVPIMADVGMQYRVKWDDSNAIVLPTNNGRILLEESLNKIQACLDDKEGMWERMLNAHENAKRMNIDNYMAEINQDIIKRL